MKILFLTNLFPPQSHGGFELWAQEAALGMQELGHNVHVLTTHESSPIPEDYEWVQRCFYPEMDSVPLVNSIRFFTQRRKRESHNLSQLESSIEAFKPDIVMIWGMWNMQRSISAYVESVMGERVVYYIGDYWLTLPNQHVHYWAEPAKSVPALILKNGLRPFANYVLSNMPHPVLTVPHALFPTRYMQHELEAQGIVPHTSAIVAGAVDLQAFVHEPSAMHEPIELLYIGRISKQKGVHTAIEAVAELTQQHNCNCRLTIVGQSEDGYAQEMKQQAEILDVADKITFIDYQPTEKIIEICQQSDILLFTSVWDEPFGRVLVEAMAAGMVVVGTGTGGSAEIMTPENSLSFEPENSAELAAQIVRLQQHPDLYMSLAKAGQAHVLQNFDSDRFVKSIAHYLDSVVNGQTTQATAS